MAVWQASITVAAPPEVVFDHLADLERHLEWTGEQELGLTSLEITSNGPVGVGTTWRSVGKNVFGAPNYDESIITAFDRPSRLEHQTFWQLGDARLRFDHVYELASGEAGTRVTHRVEQIEALNPAGEPFAAMTRQYAEAGNASVADGLAHFAAYVERLTREVAG